jgi:tripartite motif-containing protein 71
LRAAVLAVGVALALATPARAELEFLGEFGAPGAGELVVPRDVELDGAGSSYVADPFRRVVTKFGPNGNVLGVFGSGEGQGRLTLPVAVGLAPGGDVLVADLSFQGVPMARIVRYDENGGFLGQFGELGTAEGQFGFITGVSVEPLSGRIFVVEGTNNRVQRFAPNGSFELMWGKDVAGGGVGENCVANCKAGEPGTAEKEFDSPTGIVAADAVVVVSESENNRLQRFNLSGAFETMVGRNVGGPGNHECLANCQAGISGSGLGHYARPAGIALLPGEVFVADSGNARVQRLNLLTMTALEQFGTTGTGDGQFAALNGLGAANGRVATTDVEAPRVQLFSAAGAFEASFGAPAPSSLRGPLGIALAPGGVYVADAQRHQIVHFRRDGSFVGAFGSEGTGPGELLFPSGMATDPAGNLLVADRVNHRVQRFDPDGNLLGAFGTFGTGPGEFASPEDVAVGAGGEVYVVERGNDRIQKLTSIGGFLGSWGASGAAPGQFDSPEAIAIDLQGKVYVADSGNDRIQRFDSDGGFELAWGAPGTGPGELRRPGGIAVDALGNVFVAERENSRVQRFDREGAFLGWLGTGAGDGTPGSAPGEFASPSAIGVDGNGDLYVVDSGNSRVQRFAGALGPPSLVLRARKRQRHARLRARVRCRAAPCTVVLRGRAVVKQPRKKARRFPLKRRRLRLDVGEARTVRLKLRRHKRSARRASRLLRRRGKVRGRAVINARASNAAGADRAKRAVKLRRPR